MRDVHVKWHFFKRIKQKNTTFKVTKIVLVKFLKFKFTFMLLICFIVMSLN